MTLAPPAMPGVQRDPAGVPAHHLDDERAVVAVAGGVQPVDRLHRHADGGVEAEGVVGGVQVVVDRLRDADARARPPRPAWWPPRGCPRRRSGSARRCPAAPGWPAPARRRRRRRRGWCARCRAPCRRGAGCPRTARGPWARCRPRARPRQPSRNPTISSPCSPIPLRTTARMTALRPGQSPPPVRMPMRTYASEDPWCGDGVAHDAALGIPAVAATGCGRVPRRPRTDGRRDCR